MLYHIVLCCRPQGRDGRHGPRHPAEGGDQQEDPGHIYTYVYIYIYMYMYVYVCIYTCVCIYIYIYVKDNNNDNQ